MRAGLLNHKRLTQTIPIFRDEDHKNEKSMLLMWNNFMQRPSKIPGFGEKNGGSNCSKNFCFQNLPSLSCPEQREAAAAILRSKRLWAFCYGRFEAINFCDGGKGQQRTNGLLTYRSFVVTRDVLLSNGYRPKS